MDKINKWLKYLWLFNGIIFLIWAFFEIIPRINLLFKSKPVADRSGIVVGEKLEKAKEEKIELQALKIDRPIIIDRTNFTIIPTSQKLYEEPVKMSYLKVSRPEWKPSYQVRHGLFNNLIFLNNKNMQKHVLFDEQVLIYSIAIPREDIGHLIYYEVIKEDTNNDGMLYYKDHRTIYTSDLYGNNLRSYKLPDCRLRYIYPQENDKLYLFVTRDTNNDGEYTEHDQDLLYNLNLENSKYEEIIDIKLIDKIKRIAFR